MIFPWWAKPVALLLLVAGLIGGYAWWQHRTEQRGAMQERARLEAQADLQREANRGRVRDAEAGYQARTIYRDRFITQTITEVRDATAGLAACPVPDAAVGLLNRAAQCAREARPAACGAGDGVRDPG